MIEYPWTSMLMAGERGGGSSFPVRKNTCVELPNIGFPYLLHILETDLSMCTCYCFLSAGSTAYAFFLSISG
jgi:hypothetical protein